MGSARAQAQPTAGPLHILCSGQAGSIPDIVARRVAVQWTARTAQTVVVDNRPGAAGRPCPSLHVGASRQIGPAPAAGDRRCAPCKAQRIAQGSRVDARNGLG